MYKLILIINLFFASLCLGADTASDYFHRGAQYYIWGQKEKSKQEIVTGLNLFPNDPQLNGLAALLKKEEQQQQQQQNQQQNQSEEQEQKQQQQDQQQKQEQQQASNQSQEQKDKEKQQQQQQQKEEEQKQQANQASGQKQEQSDEKAQKDAAAYAAGQMTPEQAEQLLDAQKGEEEFLQLKPEGKPQDHTRPIKDW